MATIRTISIGMRADASLLVDEVDRSTRALDRFGQAADRTQRAAAGMTLAPARSAGVEVGTPGGGEAAAAGSGIRDIAATAGLIGQAFQAALSPVAQVFGKVEAEIDRAGGTIVTLARRIDAVIKAPGIEEKFALANARIREGIVLADRIGNAFSFKKAIVSVADFVFKFADAMDSPPIYAAAAAGIIASAFVVAMAKAATVTLQGAMRIAAGLKLAGVAAAKLASDISTKLTFMGNVARKSLGQLFSFKLTGPIVQIQKFTTGLMSVVPGANAASRSIKSFGGQLLVAFGVFGLAYKVADFFKGGIKEASDLNETINKTNVIFGKSSGIVAASADEMATKYGTVKTTFMDTASEIGNLLKGMGGQSEKTAATMGAQLTKAAADVSSIANISMEEAAGKITSALRGQSEPISSLGVDMSEAAVKAEALRMGLAKAGGEMTTQEKVAARTTLIVKGLAFAQGDLANTIEGPANATRRLQGNLTNLAGSIGSTMLPVLEKGIGLLNDFAAWLARAFEGNKDALAAFSERVAATIDYTGAVFRHLPAAWEIVKLKLREGVLNVIALFEPLPVNLKIIGEWIANNWSKLIVDGVHVAINAFQNLGTNIANLWTAIQGFARGEGFHFEFTPLLEGFKATAAELPELVKPEFVSLKEEIDKQLAVFDKDLADRAAKRKALADAAKPRAAVPLPLEGMADKTAAAKQGPAFAGALEVGTKEAFSAQLKFSVGGQEDAIKGVKKNTGEALAVQKQMLIELRKMTGGAPAAPGLVAAPL